MERYAGRLHIQKNSLLARNQFSPSLFVSSSGGMMVGVAKIGSRLWDSAFVDFLSLCWMLKAIVAKH